MTPSAPGLGRAAKGCLMALAVFGHMASLAAADWVRPGLTTNVPIWGRVGGLQVALPPAGFRGPGGGPRGLLRLGYPILPHGGYDLVNFIAIEPVVAGQRGFSELEASRWDGTRGKRLWTQASAGAGLDPGELTWPAPGVERLTVAVRVERFDNGAHVRLRLVQRSDTPDEVSLTVFAEPDSAPLEFCILTATMGNMARTRQLWLAGRVVTSTGLYPDLRGTGFAPHTLFGLGQLQRMPDGEVVVAVTNDETNPAAVFPFPGTHDWYYGGRKVTQYWKKPTGTYRDDLAVAVNARYAYWQSDQPLPGGVAFENFELRERFYQGQQFIFGITGKTAAALGFHAPAASGGAR